MARRVGVAMHVGNRLVEEVVRMELHKVERGPDVGWQRRFVFPLGDW
jgi:hypothetical protein